MFTGGFEHLPPPLATGKDGAAGHGASESTGGQFGLRWQAERDTAFARAGPFQSAVALRLPAQSKERLEKLARVPAASFTDPQAGVRLEVAVTPAENLPRTHRPEGTTGN